MATATDTFQRTEWAFEASSGDPSTATFDSSSISLEPVSDTVGVNQDIQMTEAIMGSRFEFSERSRIVGELVSGQLTYECSPDVLSFFLAYITGDATSPHTLQEGTCLDFDFMRDEPATDWLFRNCFISQAVFSPSGGKVRAVLDVVGKVGTIDETFANEAIQTDTASESYIDADVVVNIASAQRYCETWQLTINNGLELFQRQSLTYNRTRLGPASVTFNANVEWSSANEAALYAQGVGGVAATVTLSRENMSTVFSMPQLVIPSSPLNVDGGESLWNFSGTARRTVAAADPITITHDGDNAT